MQVQAEDTDDLPPALNGIYLARQGEKPGWGITHQRAAIYTLDGTHQGYLPGGTLVEYHTKRTSSKGAMAECSTLTPPAPPLLISFNDLRLFTASHQKLSTRQLDALRAYYELNSKIVLRKNELLLASGSQNPYFNDYQAAYKKLMAHIDHAKDLTVQRDTATSSATKIQLSDQLRSMKMDENSLRTAYDKLHQQFRAWKQAHEDTMPKAENDQQIRAWAEEMKNLRTRVPGLAY
jgi:chromosome segregation ATPase